MVIRKRTERGERINMTEQTQNKGRFILVYSPEAGDGKSTSCLQSLPQPILDIYVEERNPNTSLEALEGSKIDVDFLMPRDQEEMISELNKIESDLDKGVCKYRSVMLDSMSYWMNVTLLTRMEDETSEAEIFKKKRKLVDSTRSDEAVYGSLASHLNRICRILKRISQKGLIVVVIAQSMESPKWNRDLGLAPHFIGKKFNLDLKSHFDLIGLVLPRFTENGDMVYPPNISFKCPDGSFVAKWTGKPLKNPTGTLDFKKILQLV